MPLSCHGICENLIIEYLCGHGNVKILIFCHNNVKKNSKSSSLCCPNCVEILLLYVYDVLITWRCFIVLYALLMMEDLIMSMLFMVASRSYFCHGNVVIYSFHVYAGMIIFFMESVESITKLLFVLFFPCIKCQNNNPTRKFFLPKCLLYHENNHIFFFFCHIGLG